LLFVLRSIQNTSMQVEHHLLVWKFTARLYNVKGTCDSEVTSTM
jgi:hypothetical protein